MGQKTDDFDTCVMGVMRSGLVSEERENFSYYLNFFDDYSFI